MLKPAPLVSIVLPTFNRLHYLSAAVDSVFAQTFEDWELIVADDGSEAATRSYLHTFESHPRVRVLWLAHSGNPPAVRNVALREARGDYIAFLDSDDVWAPRKLQLQVATLRANPARAWSYTGFTLIDAAGQPLTGARARRCPPIEGEFLAPLIKGEPLIVQSSVVARRDLIQKAGGYDEELSVCGDYALWLKLAQWSEIGLIEESLVLVRRHREQYSDDIAGLEDLRRMFGKMQVAEGGAEANRLLQARRAKVGADLAKAHARRHERARVFKTLSASAPRSWRYPVWWRGALAAMVLAFVPSQIVRVGKLALGVRFSQR